MANQARHNQEDLKKLQELIKDVDTAMLTTKSDEGLVSRPMKTQEVEFDGDLWFFTKKNTDKYQEFLRDADVNVSYAGDSYVSVRGRAEIVDDLEKKRELWSPGYEKIMQTTYDDPSVILFKVKAEAAEYWATGNITETAINLFKKMTGNDEKAKDMNNTIEFE